MGSSIAVPARLMGDDYKVEWLIRHFNTRDDFENAVNNWQETQTKCDMAVQYASRVSTMIVTMIAAVQSAGVSLDKDVLSIVQLSLGLSVMCLDTICAIIGSTKATNVENATKQFPPEFFNGKQIPWKGAQVV